MSLTDRQLTDVERLLRPMTDRPMPPAVRAQLRYAYRVQGHAVVLYESRPRFDRPRVWLDHDIAKFRYLASRRVWRLYCQFRDLRWHSYEPHPEARDLRRLVAEVERDPTGIFWG
jgi:hypothetical protein